MRILVIHNAYQQRGGEDAVVNNEVAMLRVNGNEVCLRLVSNRKISGLMWRLRAACASIFSVGSYRSITTIIREFKPDVVHVHNFFPLISPSVFYACRAQGVPVIFTLHNYRIVCPTALLMHDGSVTERSLREGPWWALKHRVYRGSLVGTFFLCLMIWLHQRLGTWSNGVDRFIVLSEFARARFELAGLPAGKLAVKPNFVDIDAPPEQNRSGLLFVGRLSPEKGLQVLLSAFQIACDDGMAPGAVRLAGEGPLAELVRQSDLTWFGALPSDQVRVRMRSASALLLPSVCYEGLPLVLVEAYASGLPVIASRIGALAELVEDGVTGLLFEPGSAEDLADKMRWAIDHPEEMARMGRVARERYEARYTPETSYSQLMAIYNEAIEAVKKEGRARA